MSNGQVVQRVDIVFDKAYVQAAGFNDLNLFMGKVETVVNIFLQQKENAYSSELGQRLMNGTISLSDLEILSDAGIATVARITNGIRVEKAFGNVNAFMYYNYRTIFDPRGHLVDVPFERTQNMTTDEQLFIVNYIEKCYTLYHGQEQLMADILSAVNSELGTAFATTEANLTFTFITPFRRLHSDGQVNQDGDYYVHTWNVNNPNNTITISRTVANSGMWYVIALLAVLFSTVFAALIYLALDKTRKRKVDPRELADMLDQINKGIPPPSTGTTQGIHMADIIKAAKENDSVHKEDVHAEPEIGVPDEPSAPDPDWRNSPTEPPSDEPETGSDSLQENHASQSQPQNSAANGLFAFNVSQFLREVSGGKEQEAADNSQKENTANELEDKEAEIEKPAEQEKQSDEEEEPDTPPLSPLELENMLKEINSPQNRIKKEKDDKND
jgi:hypothetical protein